MKSKKKKCHLPKRVLNFILSSRPIGFIALKILAGTILNLFLLLLFVDIAFDIHSVALVKYDMQISMFIYSLRTPALTPIMILISFLGMQFMLVMSTLIFIFILLRKHRKEAALFAVTLIIGAILDTVLKSITARPRPSLSPLVFESSYSFPSGHAMNSFLFYFLMAYLSFHFWRNKQLSFFLTLVAAIIVALIGFSRVYLGVHYPSDVLAGYIIGFWWLLTVILIDHTLVFFKLFRQSE